MQEMEARVDKDANDNERTNTDLAYGPKLKEFMGFCQSLYAENTPVGADVYTVTEEKLYKFAFYHAYRENHRKGGCKKKQQCTTNSQDATVNNSAEDADEDADGDENELEAIGTSKFDRVHYDQVIAKYAGNSDAQPQKPVGYSCVQQNICAVMELLSLQRQNGCNNRSDNEVKSHRVCNLLKLVQARRVKVSRRNYEEKLDKELLPYLNSQEYDRMEEAFWDKANDLNTHNALIGLRNRDCFLWSKSAILRGESLFYGELSDCLDVIHKSDATEDPTPYHIMIQQIDSGKTHRLRKGHKLFGRAIRHKNPALCAMGARGFHLMYRFHVTGELDAMDFTSNNNWFDVKIMIDPHSGNYKKEMSDQTFRNAVGSVCRKLGIQTKHYTHFGRVVASGNLELQEIPGDEIDELGNWNVSVRDAIYSAKMPLRPMRGAAGFSADKGRHYSPRQSYQADSQLAEQIFPSVEAHEAKIAAAEIANPELKLTTAKFFLRHLRNLRQVILQDAAILISQGRHHRLFELPVFKSSEFLQFQQGILRHIADAESTLVHLSSAGTSSAVAAHLATIGSEFAVQKEEQSRQFGSLHGKLDVVIEQQQAAFSGTDFAHGLRAAAAAIDRSSDHRQYNSLPMPTGMDVTVATTTVAAPTTITDLMASRTGGFFDSLQASEIPASIKNARRAYNLWFGHGEFAGCPMIGGVAALERKPGNIFKKWKAAMSGSQRKRFARAEDLASAIINYKGKNDGCTWDEAIDYVDSLLKQKSPDDTIKELKEKGYLPKGRGSKKRFFFEVSGESIAEVSGESTAHV
jgi:hypothetical protein